MSDMQEPTEIHITRLRTRGGDWIYIQEKFENVCFWVDQDGLYRTNVIYWQSPDSSHYDAELPEFEAMEALIDISDMSVIERPPARIQRRAREAYARALSLDE